MNLHQDIQGSYIGRNQSPRAEVAMSQLIHDAIKDLLEGCFLYQNKSIDLSSIKQMADKQFSAAELENEFTNRPWIPYSQNRGYTSAEKSIMSGGRGCDPLGTPPRMMHLLFVLPTISTWCDVCKINELHDSIPHIEFSPYHLNPEAIQEPNGFHTFLFNYQCHRCKSSPVTFMVRRELLKVQLCGRSKPYFPNVPREIPKNLRQIYADSVAAAACGDWPASFYHLRTMMEHHMKFSCAIPIAEQIDGMNLCEKYNKLVDPIVTQRAALTDIFASCCVNLHNRTGGQADFQAALNRVHGHFKLIENLKSLN